MCWQGQSSGGPLMETAPCVLLATCHCRRYPPRGIQPCTKSTKCDSVVCVCVCLTGARSRTRCPWPPCSSNVCLTRTPTCSDTTQPLPGGASPMAYLAGMMFLFMLLREVSVVREQDITWQDFSTLLLETGQVRWPPPFCRFPQVAVRDRLLPCNPHGVSMQGIIARNV